MYSSATSTTNETMTRLAVILSVVSLFFSGWAFIASFDDDSETRRIQERLACLELPGANDCGVDGR